MLRIVFDKDICAQTFCTFGVDIFVINFLRGVFRFVHILYVQFQQCLICRPSDSTVSEDDGFEPRDIAMFALAARRSNH